MCVERKTAQKKIYRKFSKIQAMPPSFQVEYQEKCKLAISKEISGGKHCRIFTSAGNFQDFGRRVTD
jgi:hypothetical protein